MTKTQDFFATNGYYIARNLLPKQDVIKAIESLSKSIGEQIDILHLTAADNIAARLKTLLNEDETRYKNIVGSLWRKLDLFNLCHHQNIIDFLSSELKMRDLFLPGGQVLHIMSEELRIKNGYFGLGFYIMRMG